MVLAMVRRQPMALQHASFRRRRNLEIVLAALEQDSRVFVLAIVNSAGRRALERQRDCMRVFFEEQQFDKDELESRTAKIATIPEDLQLLSESSHSYSADRRVWKRLAASLQRDPAIARAALLRVVWSQANHLKVCGRVARPVLWQSNVEFLCALPGFPRKHVWIVSRIVSRTSPRRLGGN